MELADQKRVRRAMPFGWQIQIDDGDACAGTERRQEVKEQAIRLGDFVVHVHHEDKVYRTKRQPRIMRFLVVRGRGAAHYEGARGRFGRQQRDGVPTLSSKRGYCSPRPGRRFQCAASTVPPARQVRIAANAVRPRSMPVAMTEQTAA